MSTLPEPLQNRIETALNRLLDSHPEHQAAVQALEGYHIQGNLSVPPIEIQASIQKGRVRIEMPGQPEPDTRVNCGPATLIQWLEGTDVRSLIRNGTLGVEGDLERLHRLQMMASSLDLDWAGLLEEKIGVLPASLVEQCVRKGRHWVKYVSGQARLDLQEFLHEELKVLPTRKKAERFFSDTQTQHMHLERLEARLKKLLNRNDA
jgi:ubiquinone biosynthesis protein UbiJ